MNFSWTALKRELFTNDVVTNYATTTAATYVVSYRPVASLVTGVVATAALRLIKARSDPANWEKDRFLFPAAASAVCGMVATYGFPDPESVAAVTKLGTALNDSLSEELANDNAGHVAAHVINKRMNMGTAAMMGFLIQLCLKRGRNWYARRKNPGATPD